MSRAGEWRREATSVSNAAARGEEPRVHDVKRRERRVGDRASAHLLRLHDDDDDVSGSHVDLAVLGVDGMHQLEAQIVRVLLFGAVRARHRGEGEDAVVRQIHLRVLRVRALDGDEEAVFALRPEDDGRAVRLAHGHRGHGLGFETRGARDAERARRGVRRPTTNPDATVDSSEANEGRGRKRLPGEIRPEQYCSRQRATRRTFIRAARWTRARARWAAISARGATPSGSAPRGSSSSTRTTRGRRGRARCARAPLRPPPSPNRHDGAFARVSRFQAPSLPPPHTPAARNPPPPRR